MAGAGYKLFNTGDVLTAAQVNTYLQEQTVMVFADATARTTALSGVLAEGMMTYLKSDDTVYVYNGSSWVSVANTGDITGITTGATSGLTGGVTSGTADLKFNTTAKGGLLIGTGSGTVSELAVGTNNYVLTADSTQTTGVKWAAAASGGKIAQVVVANLLTTASTSSTSYADTGLTVTITPSSASNTILIHATVPFGMSSASVGGFLTLANGSGTNLLNPTSPGSRTVGYTRFEGSDQYSVRSTSIIFQHSPASTSAQTYKIQFKVNSGTATAYVNRMGTDSNAADYLAGIATIVAYEVSA